jgi:hypothetical protein
MGRDFLLLVAILCGLTAHAGNTFDDLITAQDGKIPRPFSELLRAVGRSSVTLIPNGRSRQRAQADYEQPRFVVAQGQPDVSDPATLFIGYAPKAKQLEVIAWNSGEGRFDFLEVVDYSPDLEPKLRKPAQERCTICHQGGAPLFSRFPWSETLFNGAVVGGILKARQGDATYHGLKYDDPQGGSLVGTDISVDPGKLDFQVRRANRRLQSSNVVRSVCNDAAECRRKILLAALIDPSWRFRGDRRACEMRDRIALELQQTLTPAWPTHRFAYPSSLLPDRDSIQGVATVFDIDDRRRLLPYSHPELFPESLLLKADLNFEDRLSEFLLNEARGLTPRTFPSGPVNPGHPVFSRPKVSEIEPERIGTYITRSAHEALGFDLIAGSDREWLQKQSPDRIERAVQKLDVSLWPLDLADVIRKIKETD